MQFVIKRDISNFFKKNWKLIIFSLAVILCYCSYAKINYENPKDLFIVTLGLHIYKDHFPVDILMFIFYIIFDVYIVFWLFSDMLKGNIENLFLRLPMKKWILYKEFSIMLISTILKFSFYIVAILCSRYVDFSDITFLFIIDLVVTFTYEMLIILLLIMFYKNKFLTVISVVILLILLLIYFPKTILLISEDLIIIITCIFTYFILCMLINKFMTKMYIFLFERSR